MTSFRLTGTSWNFGLFAGLLLSAALASGAFATGCGSSVSALSTDGGAAGSSPAAGAAGQSGSAGGVNTGTAGTKAAAGTTGSMGTGGMTGTAGATGAGGSINNIPIGQTQCSDGKDNDGDGKIDLADPECTSPADNDESSFATGIPGDNVDACKQDCFFDGNSGMGDDGCLWELKCDPKSNTSKCPYDASYAQKHQMECSVSDSQSQRCIDNCRKYVPNGCDCFGCCAVPGAATPIRLDPTCTSKDFNDPTKCSPCTQVTQCMNPCDRCEICVGKDSVPADCQAPKPDGGAGGMSGADGGNGAGGTTGAGGTYGTPTCTGGISCTVGGAACPSGFACVTGCCLAIIP
jgi:hypothetical protein